MLFAKLRLAISRLQWTRAKRIKSAQRDKVRADVAVESDERQEVIASKSLVAGRDSQIFRQQNDQSRRP